MSSDHDHFFPKLWIVAGQDADHVQAPAPIRLHFGDQSGFRFEFLARRRSHGPRLDVAHSGQVVKPVPVEACDHQLKPGRDSLAPSRHRQLLATLGYRPDEQDSTGSGLLGPLSLSAVRHVRLALGDSSECQDKLVLDIHLVIVVPALLVEAIADEHDRGRNQAHRLCANDGGEVLAEFKSNLSSIRQSEAKGIVRGRALVDGDVEFVNVRRAVSRFESDLFELFDQELSGLAFARGQGQSSFPSGLA